MATASTQALWQYYSNLLLLQYLTQPNAVATVQLMVQPFVMDQLPAAVMNAYNLVPSIQTITFSAAPTTGSFVLKYQGVSTSALSYSASTASIQTALNAIVAPNKVTVTGSLASLSLVVTFMNLGGVTVLTNPTNTTGKTITITNNVAQGVQLDIIGKYVGVSRNGFTFSGPVTLNDSDYLQVIALAIIQNNGGSSLANIQMLITQFFPGVLQVFDFCTMRIGYQYDSSIGSMALTEFFIMGGHLPKPMGVQMSTLIYAPGGQYYFGCRTYQYAGTHNYPLNNYSTYSMSAPCLSYVDGISQ